MHAAIDHGVAELRPDPARPQGWTLLVDGVPQSYVDLADPGHLVFPYLTALVNVVRQVPPRVLHLGGGGLTMARRLHHRRPAMPASVGSAGFAAAAARVLGEGGPLAMNLTDVPPPAHSRIQAATVQTAFETVVLYGDAAVLRGRRAGNLILLAGNVPMIKVGKHEKTVRGADLADFIGGARPRLDEPA
ncbi:hypothetical protein Ade02nite_12690 [Paractinoplanes deccanensis]|uniref:Uncharacterized protein n=1 Tax=Paractinoplanes deccanensis TaxID=113561 RepID=A0ABQ3XXZ2_9ACTN|nr:hypothetical protein [Actinoplanes deccanensis]GID72628.1 hypothetical protein Ade02nite_12690 [Actinoplanes deccanensis]